MANCTIFKFDCSIENQKGDLKKLASIATEQEHEFRDIFPWQDGCKKFQHQIVFVAVKLIVDPIRQTRSSARLTSAFVSRQPETPVICGWLNLIIENERKPSCRGYISKITSRAGKDLTKTYKGVGTSLIRAAEAEAIALKLNFLYLHPLSNVVSFYQHVGYIHIPPVKHLMFKIFIKGPTTSWLSKQKPEVLTDDDLTKDIIEDVFDDSFKHPKQAQAKLFEQFKKDEQTKLQFLSMYEQSQMDDDMDIVRTWVKEQINIKGSPMSTTGPSPMSTSRGPSPKSTSSMDGSGPSKKTTIRKNQAKQLKQK